MYVFVLLKELMQCSDSVVDSEVVRAMSAEFVFSFIVFCRWWSSKMLPDALDLITTPRNCDSIRDLNFIICF